MRAREWLRQNGYSDVADEIDRVVYRWREEGKRTRRNWWEILAGGMSGKPRIAGGVSFPILRVARIRQGLPESPFAIARSDDEQAPPVRVTARWPRKCRR